MKILIHADEYYPTAQACAFRMQVFADTFQKLGDEVTVITSSANKANASASGKDCSPRKERILYAPTIRMKKKSTLLRLLNNVSFSLTSLFAAIGAGKADVVITTSPPPLISITGWLIAKCKRAKLVYDVRDIWPDVALEMGSFAEGSLFCRIFRRIARFMYKHADIVTTVSPGKVQKIQKYVAGISGKKAGAEHVGKVLQVGNGFDESVALCADDPTVTEQYELDKVPTCVYIGNIGLAQGLEKLLDVAKQTKHREIRFLLFGMGAEKEKLEKLAADNGLTNVRFCGILEHSKVFSVLRHAKLSFISLKSSSMTDSVPTKIYEALGIGCPILLVAEGDSCRIVEESQLGVCVSPDHTETLTAVFDRCLDNYDELISHKEKAVRLMHEKYSRQTIAEAFEKTLRQLTNSK